MKLPEQFLNERKDLIPDFDEFLNSYTQLPVKSFFINENKISCKAFLDNVDWEIQKYANGYLCLQDIKVGKTLEHHTGMIYMQELSAMMPVSFLPLKKGDWVLDLCASPGGKSIQVANKITDGILISNEIVKSRANILKSNIERMGLKNVIITNNEPKQLEEMFGGIFDAVIVDAPCSGEGMFRKDENARVNWSKENVQACSIRQSAILETANKMLKQNGYLLYSTCTFSLEENEKVVADFCHKHNFKIVPIEFECAINGKKIGEFATNNTLRFYPHKFKGEGQYVALLQKQEASTSFIKEKTYFKPLEKFPSECKIFKMFLKQNLMEFEDILSNAICNNNTIYYCANKKLCQSGLNLINCGVVIGEIIKQRFEPNHNFVTCFGKRFVNQVNLSTEEGERYLRGETITSNLEGYVVVKYNDVVIGLTKGSGGVLKNHYPKGLRNQ